MSTHNDPLEQLFSSQLGESFQRDGSTTWNDLQARRKAQKASFWQFSPRRMNVFYVGFFAAAISAAALTSRVYYSAPKVAETQQQQQPNNTQPSLTVTPVVAKTINEEKQIINQPQNKKPTLRELQKEEKQSIVTETAIMPDSSSLLPDEKILQPTSTLVLEANDSLAKTELLIQPAKPTKTIVIVQKQQVVVKDTTVKRVTKHVRKRGL